jgi:hypothetical protein
MTMARRAIFLHGKQLMSKQNEIDTAKIERIAAAVHNNVPCASFDALETVVEVHTKKIEVLEEKAQDTRVKFTKIDGSLERLSSDFNTFAESIRGYTKWLVITLIGGMLSVVGTSLVWVIQNMPVKG